MGNLEGENPLQNYLVNGFDKAHFGLVVHNKREMLGACSGEMLHLISLGWFHYCLEAFAGQAGGPNPLLLKNNDGPVCASLGGQLSRDSKLNLPKMNFPKGFSSSTKILGHKITGCLLVKLFAMHTTRFSQIITPPPPPQNNTKKAKNKSKAKDPKKS
ncbi:hypothetical protein MHU86_11778 [Fragilaria crotonensis]|nr:hypothetical protein MHU86_11778 [Fragilaria crotonensis]